MKTKEVFGTKPRTP